MGLSAILALLNIAIPEVGALVVAIRGKDGSTSAVVYLDEADTQFAANQDQIAKWLAAHGKTPVPLAGPQV